MRICQPTEFTTRWPGALHPIQLPERLSNLPDDCAKLLSEFGLPQQLTIYCYNNITLNFTGSLSPLAEIWDRDLQIGYQMGEMPPEWECYWHVAEQEYLQGGGWVCIEEETGKLVVIDLDIPEPIYLLNASIRSFYTTLAYFLEWTETTTGNREETVILRDNLLGQDCVPPAELEPFWMNFIYATLDGDPMNLAVRLCPAA